MEERLKAVDFEGFMEETGLDGETVKELYEVFVGEISSERDKLLSLLSAGEFIKLAETVHNIKGISGSYGLQYVYRQALELGDLIKVNGRAGIEASLKKLETLIDEAVAEIKNYYMI